MMSSARSPALEANEREQFDESGFLILPDVLSVEPCDSLSAELTGVLQQVQGSTRRTLGGLRDVLRVSPLAAQVANSQRLRSLVSDLMDREAFPVRGILFDKNATANWSVPWHQDLAIAVAKRIESSGFGPWSSKDGIVHVQPPAHILANMITVRLHLDECTADNGALRVIPGSHGQGELDTDQITAWTNRQVPVVCEIPRGGALLMRPLLLHASSRAKAALHRRVLHIEYAAVELPNGLRWFEQS